MLKKTTVIRQKSQKALRSVADALAAIKVVNRLVHNYGKQLASRDQKIKALEIENADLRQKLEAKIKKSYEPPKFVFADLGKNPQELLVRHLRDILPLNEHLDLRSKMARGRAIRVFEDSGCVTVGDMLEKCGDGNQIHVWFRRFQKSGTQCGDVVLKSLQHFNLCDSVGVRVKLV